MREGKTLMGNLTNKINTIQKNQEVLAARMGALEEKTKEISFLLETIKEEREKCSRNASIVKKLK